MTQPNLRAAPIVYDPFAVTTVDAVLSTHYHNDHIDPFFAAAVMQNCEPDVPFIGPLKSVEKWLSYGVPEERCRIVKPGDVIQVKDCEVVVLDSFDRTCLVTADEDIRNTCPNDMDEKAVNYLIKTPAGTVYHSGDSHYSTSYLSTVINRGLTIQFTFQYTDNNRKKLKMCIRDRYILCQAFCRQPFGYYQRFLQ